MTYACSGLELPFVCNTDVVIVIFIVPLEFTINGASFVSELKTCGSIINAVGVCIPEVYLYHHEYKL